MELRKNEPRSAVEMWRRRVAKTPTRAAFRLHDGAGWKVMTFAEADVATRELAAGLVARGLAPGDRICSAVADPASNGRCATSPS